MQQRSRQRSRLRFAALLVLACATVAGNGIAIGRAAAAEDDLRSAVVKIERPREGALPAEVGSGFFVSPVGHILTAAHVLLESDEGDEAVRRRPLNVRLFGDSFSRSARVLAMNRFTDLALLKMKAEGSTPILPLGDSRSVSSGDLLTIIGHPLGRQDWNVSAAIVDSITPHERIFLQATLFKGQSGGPVLNDEGQVVGIAAYREEGAQQSYVTPINDAHGLLAGFIAPAAYGAVGKAAESARPGSPGVIPSSARQPIVSEEQEPNDNIREMNVAEFGATVSGSLYVKEDDLIDYIRFEAGKDEFDNVRAIVRNLSTGGFNSMRVQFFDDNEVELLDDTVSKGNTLSDILPTRSSYIVKLTPSVGSNYEYEILVRAES